jgi:hypothetical protein
MRRRAAMIAMLALVLVGCGSGASGGTVALTTGVPPILRDTNGNAAGCYTDFAVGQLVVDPKYGTAIADTTTMAGSQPVTTPVAWRPGFTAIRVNDQVQVRDPNGAVVAVTGHSYRIDGGYVGGADWPELPTRMFWACGDVVSQ